MNHSTAIKIAEGVGSLLFLRQRRRKICLHNLHAAFPEKSQADLEMIGRSSMQGLVTVIFECIRIPVIAKDPEKYFEVQGGEHAWKALQKKKGIILAVSHFGNWELMAVASAAKGFPMHAIGKPVKNPFLYESIKRLRGATGLKSIDKKGAIRNTVQLLKNNQIVAMLIDEHVKKGEVWVDFFGRKAATSSLPAMLSLKYDSPVIPAFYYRGQGSERSIFLFGEPFHLIRTGDLQADLTANTQQYVSRLEQEVRKRPGDWTMWMHNRWREEDRYPPIQGAT
ncbi:MAG: hypothetical protein EXS63_05620 [Candidatus Omnitrophica bacterium]|nr:hypothetical protein [Candidatus Omnitrophota bacterium]